MNKLVEEFVRMAVEYRRFSNENKFQELILNWQNSRLVID